jgi:hypothetical protein
MKELSLRRGTLLLQRDPKIDTVALPHIDVIMPAELEEIAPTGFVHLHEPSDWWVYRMREEVLTGQRIIFAKWDAVEFTWEGVTLWMLSELAVLAVFEGEEEE